MSDRRRGLLLFLCHCFIHLQLAGQEELDYAHRLASPLQPVGKRRPTAWRAVRRYHIWIAFHCFHLFNFLSTQHNYSITKVLLPGQQSHSRVAAPRPGFLVKVQEPKIKTWSCCACTVDRARGRRDQEAARILASLKLVPRSCRRSRCFSTPLLGPWLYVGTKCL